MNTDSISPQRHLAAVWFADIVGYTALAARDEPAALRLIERLQSLSREEVDHCGGRVVKALGDAVMAEFPSTEAAVRAALALMDQYDSEAVGGSRAKLRIGVHVGDVMVAQDGDVYGDGVNVASRLQTEARPGEVLISGDVRRQLLQRPEYRFSPRGTGRLKGLAEPIQLYSVAPSRSEGISAAEAAETQAATGVSMHPAVRRWSLVVVAVILATGVALWMTWNSESVAERDVSSNRIAVMPFSVGGSEEVAYLGEGMVSLLSTKLDGAGDLRSVDPRALLSQVGEQAGGGMGPAEGRAIAERFGAGWYVMGDILEVGGRIRLTATLYDARSGERVEEGTVEGSSTDIFSLVDQVAVQLLAGLEGGPAARVDRIAAVTTSSLPALKAYLEGQVALRAGDFSTAVDAFQYAVDQDTLFALGYYRLSIAAEWLLRSELSHESALRAFQYADRLSQRDRRLLEAFSTFRRGEIEKAEGLYRALVATYPDEVEAWLYLGELLFHMNPVRARSQVEAREPFLKLLELEPSNTATLVHLARIEATEGRDEEVDRYVSRFIELASDADRLWPMRALRAFSRQDRAAQDRFLEEVERTSGATLTLIIWDIAISARDVPGAERAARIMTASWRPAEERALGHLQLAHFLLAQGRWGAAQQELDAAEALDPAAGLEHRALLSSVSFVPATREELTEIRDDLRAFDATAVPDAQNPETFFASHNGLHPLLREYLLGLVSARLGDAPAADSQARRTAETSAPPIVGSLPADLALGIRAQALIGQDRTQDALDSLGQLRFAINYNPMIASPFVSLAYERFTRAELLRQTGRHDEALAWYRNMFGCTSFEVVYLAIAHFRQGEIHDQRGERELAVHHYSEFVDLWRDADPEFRQLVERAERRLAELRRS